MFRGLRIHLRQGPHTQVERRPFRELTSFDGPCVIFNCRVLIVLSKGANYYYCYYYYSVYHYLESAAVLVLINVSQATCPFTLTYSVPHSLLLIVKENVLDFVLQISTDYKLVKTYLGY